MIVQGALAGIGDRHEKTLRLRRVASAWESGAAGEHRPLPPELIQALLGEPLQV